MLKSTPPPVVTSISYERVYISPLVLSRVFCVKCLCICVLVYMCFYISPLFLWSCSRSCLLLEHCGRTEADRSPIQNPPWENRCWIWNCNGKKRRGKCLWIHLWKYHQDLPLLHPDQYCTYRHLRLSPCWDENVLVLVIFRSQLLFSSGIGIWTLEWLRLNRNLQVSSSVLLVPVLLSSSTKLGDDFTKMKTSLRSLDSFYKIKTSLLVS